MAEFDDGRLGAGETEDPGRCLLSETEEKPSLSGVGVEADGSERLLSDGNHSTPAASPSWQCSGGVVQGLEESRPVEIYDNNDDCAVAFLEQGSCGASEVDELSDDVKRETLLKGLTILTRKSQSPGGSCHVYLLGTAHVSQESCRDVHTVIHHLKPEVVFVELCEKRRLVLTLTHVQVPTMSEMIASWKEKRANVFGILYSWFLAKVAAKMDVVPGSEFRVAYEEAKKCGAKVVLGDRDVQVTLRRTWGKMSLWYKVKFISVLLFQAFSLPSVKELKEMIQGFEDSDMITLAFQELGKSFPSVVETLVHERDMFMTACLQKIAEEHSSIVAVVGRGHISGIRKYWDQDISVHMLMDVPKKASFWTKYKCCTVVPVVIAGAACLVYAHYNFR